MNALGAMRGFVRRLSSRDRILLSFLAAYVTLCVLPLAHRRAVIPTLGFASLLPPPLVLAAGLALVRREHPRAVYVLLAGVPLTLVFPACILKHEVALTTFAGAGLALALLTFAGYVAAAAQLCSDAEPRYPSEHRPLGRGARADSPPRRRYGDAVLWTVCVCVSLAVVLGASGTPLAYRTQFREAAPEGAALTGVVAGVVATLGIVLLGPYLRAARPTDPREQSRTLRLLPAILWIASGAAMYVLSRP